MPWSLADRFGMNRAYQYLPFTRVVHRDNEMADFIGQRSHDAPHTLSHFSPCTANVRLQVKLHFTFA
jgi:hypothetical protein